MSEQIWKCFKWGGGCGRTAVTSDMGSTACGCGGVMRPELTERPHAKLKAGFVPAPLRFVYALCFNRASQPIKQVKP